MYDDHLLHVMHCSRWEGWTQPSGRYCCSVAESRLTLCDPMDCSTLSFRIFHYLPEFAQTHVHWVVDAIQPSHPLSPPCPAVIFPGIGVFSSESALCIRWPKLWSFSFIISPPNECSELTSFWIDGFDFFAVQETLKSLFQHHSLKESILQGSDFFRVQLSHPYMEWETNIIFPFPPTVYTCSLFSACILTNICYLWSFWW